jgi:hypothetical protein
MTLYHGTSSDNIPFILSHGLMPRGPLNRRSNWDHTVKSRVGHVYLTSAYGFYFAAAAASASETALATVLEIDMAGADEAKFYPDEDFIGQALNDVNSQKKQLDLLTMTRRIKLEPYKSNWGKSLEHMGNVSFKGVIEPSRIKRIATVDINKRRDLQLGYGDNSVSIMAFRVMRPSYQGFLAWLFGDRAILPAMAGASVEDMEKLGGPWAERAEYIRKQSADRSGIEVRTP